MKSTPTQQSPASTCGASIWRWPVLAVALIGIAIAAFCVRHWLVSPDVILLVSQDGAQWIRPDESLGYQAHFTGKQADFRTNLQIPPGFEGGVLWVCALRHATVSVDGVQLEGSGANEGNWKIPHDVPLPAHLSAGAHELLVKATNESGPALVRVYCPQLQLRSGNGWDARGDDQIWKPALLATAAIPNDIADHFGPVWQDVLAMSPLLVVCFTIGFVFAWRQRNHSTLQPKTGWAPVIRWATLFAFALLAVNNMFKVPTEIGYDHEWHFMYIANVAGTGRLPLPNQFWEAFQAPLYYMISAALLRGLAWFDLTLTTGKTLLRIVPLLCGMSLIELSYRTARYAFPRRSDLWAVAAVIGGLVPMNLYMSVSLSNEPMAGLFGGLITLSAVRLMGRPQNIRPVRDIVVCGIILGLALLTKVTAFLWIPPFCFAVIVAWRRRGSSLMAAARSVGLMLAVALLVSGWYFARNWYVMGRPIYTGSEVVGRASPWQSPGFRTPAQMLRFGHVLVRPVYPDLTSMWDSLYSTMWADGFLSGYDITPPWNYRSMSCGIWLGWVPITLIVIGGIRGFKRTAKARRREDRREGENDRVGQTVDEVIAGFAVLAIVTFAAGIIYEYVNTPMFSYGKSSIMLGTLPCMGLLAAAGLDWMSRSRWLNAIAIGTLTCWAVTAYVAFFVI
jgi:Dolichyl-phosphate-mannose-protein mannosyltransferase